MMVIMVVVVMGDNINERKKIYIYRYNVYIEKILSPFFQSSVASLTRARAHIHTYTCTHHISSYHHPSITPHHGSH